jgi:hypothetical protein
VVKLSPLELQSAADYDDRSTQAVKSVLLEIGQILGSYKGKFVVVGGRIPWLLQNDEEMPHVGSLDINLWSRTFVSRESTGLILQSD